MVFPGLYWYFWSWWPTGSLGLHVHAFSKELGAGNPNLDKMTGADPPVLYIFIICHLSVLCALQKAQHHPKPLSND